MNLKSYSKIVFLVSLFFLGATQTLAQDIANDSASFFDEDLNSISATKLELSELERTPTTLSGTLSPKEADVARLSSRFLSLIDLEVDSIVEVTLKSQDFDTHMILIRENDSDSDSGAEVILDSRGYLAEGTHAHVSFLVEEGASYVVGVTGYDAGDYSIDVRIGESISKELESFEAYQAGTYTVDPSFTLKLGAIFGSNILNTLDNYYKLPIFAGGEEITVSIESQDFHPNIYLIDLNNGTTLVENDDFSRMLSISFVAEADIEYLVKVTSWKGHGSGTYELVLTDFFVEDIANITAAELNVPELGSITLSDTLGPEIVDTPDLSSAYYTLTDLVVGSIATVTLDSEDFDTYMFLIQESDDGRASSEIIMDTIDKEYSEESNESQISFLVEEGVSYVMEATSYFSDWSGNFNIDVATGEAISERFESFETYSIERYPGEKYINADFVDLAQGSSAEGQLDRGPAPFINEVEFLANYYKLPTFVGGEELTVSVESEAFDTYIYLIDATNGAYVAENDDFGDNYQMSSVSFVVEADTEYLVKVTTGTAYGWGTYDLVASTK